MQMINVFLIKLNVLKFKICKLGVNIVRKNTACRMFNC